MRRKSKTPGMTDHAGQENAAPSMLSLPSDLQQLVLSFVALADVCGVAQFGLTCRAAAGRVLRNGDDITRLCADVLTQSGRVTSLCVRSQEGGYAHTHAQGTEAEACHVPPRDGMPSLQLLALHQAVEENLGAMTWLLFKPGTDELKPGEAPRLARAATLLRRFEGAKLQVEAHAAAAAPVDTADKLSHDRALVVLRELLQRGVQRERLQARAWGRRHSVHWPDDATTARVEIFFELREWFVPSRSHEYTELKDAVQPISRSVWPWPAADAASAAGRGGSVGGGGGTAARPMDTSRRGLLNMVRQVRAEKESSRTPASTTAHTAAAQPSDRAASSGGGGVDDDPAAAVARQRREQLARAAEQRLGRLVKL